MPNNHFRFKQFLVKQDQTAMKVGTDGVLLGAWVDICGATHILDVGTGTGLIALMLAQRAKNSIIDAVEIDEQSALQAKENVSSSKWSDRIVVFNSSFQQFASEAARKYELIVSNPPYFIKSLKSESIARTVARHNELLSHSDLLQGINKLLTDDGRFVGIFPYVEGNVFVALASNYGLFCTRRVHVIGKEKGIVKRLLLEFCKNKLPIAEDNITIRCQNDEFTQEYITLTKDFYLAF
jgi:tRNA1Val (adenine37-N6)-methyltransferase